MQKMGNYLYASCGVAQLVPASFLANSSTCLSILGEFPNFLGICMYFYIHVNHQNYVLARVL